MYLKLDKKTRKRYTKVVRVFRSFEKKYITFLNFSIVRFFFN